MVRKKNLCTRGFLAAMAGLFISIGCLYAESIDALNGKVQLESHMEARLKQILVPFAGTDNLIAIVRLGLVDRNASPEKGGNTLRKWDENEDIVLPGVPAATSMTKKTRSEELTKDLARLRLSNVSVTVIVGKKLSQEKVDKIKQLVFNAFGLDLEAGDVLNVETYGASSGYFNLDQVRMGELIALLGLILSVVFLFGPVRGFMRTLNENLNRIGETRSAAAAAGEEDMADDKDESSDARSGVVAIAGQMPAAAAVSGGNATLRNLITKDNLEDLTLILQNESPEIIAEVVQNLPPSFAFVAIPPAKRAEVVAQFVHTQCKDPQEIKKTIDRITSKIEGSFGGAARLSRIVQPLDRATQEKVLASLKKTSAEFAAKVENRLFRFEDILRYDDQNLRRIFRKAGTESFIRCLKGCSEEITQKFYGKLGPSITSLITTRLKTFVAAGDMSEAELKIMQAIEGLSTKGLIPPLEQVKTVQ